jgi:3-oxoacyl-(acyl-carrier-protein) synthase
MMTDSIVITGIGTLTPFGEGHPSLLAGFTNNKTHSNKIPKVAYETILSKKELRRLDPIAVNALYATHLALTDGKVPLDNKKRIGTCLGIHFGGWETFEAVSQSFKEKGYRGLRPTKIPSALQLSSQGAIGTYYSLLGNSKTFSSGALSGAHALYHACQLIKSGELDIVCVCGSETPLSPFAQEYITATISDGYPLSEGACSIILENKKHAIQRKASIYAEVDTILQSIEMDLSTTVELENIYKQFNLSDFDLYFSETEHEALPTPFCTKKSLGESVAPSYLFDVALASLLQHSSSQYNRSLIAGRSHDGINIITALS